jgi:hypothetical protein
MRSLTVECPGHVPHYKRFWVQATQGCLYGFTKSASYEVDRSGIMFPSRFIFHENPHHLFLYKIFHPIISHRFLEGGGPNVI